MNEQKIMITILTIGLFIMLLTSKMQTIKLNELQCQLIEIQNDIYKIDNDM